MAGKCGNILRHIAAIQQSLTDAWAECASLMGADATQWAWGDIHKLELRHPLQSLTEDDWSIEPLALGGSSSTLNYATYRLHDFSVVAGPSVRMVIDVGIGITVCLSTIPDNRVCLHRSTIRIF